jgi:cytochrome P450
VLDHDPRTRRVTAPALPTDLLAAEAVDDPHEVFAQLRDAGPVVWLPEHHAWLLTTYDEVQDGFRDVTRLSSDRLTPLEARLDRRRRALLGETFELLRGWMVFHDPPHHERLKGPVRRAFTPKRVEALRPHVEALVDDLLDEMADEGTTDVVARLAFPLPAIVIAELLGVPPEDRDRFKEWSRQLAAIVFGAGNRADQAETAAAGSAQFVEYFSALIARYERDPADNLVSALIAARDTADAFLTANELVGALTLLLFGGHETTTNLIGNAVIALLRHPDELAWLRANPDAAAGAVEELHRYDGPTKVMPRVVALRHERHGQRLEPGQIVFLGVAGANRDPAVFDDPDRLWLARPDAQHHVGFGYGLHYCLGAPLARLEAQVALAALARRFPSMALATDELRYGATILGRGLGSLPVALRG